MALCKPVNHWMTTLLVYSHSERERDVGIISVKIDDGLALGRREGEKERKRVTSRKEQANCSSVTPVTEENCATLVCRCFCVLMEVDMIKGYESTKTEMLKRCKFSHDWVLDSTTCCYSMGCILSWECEPQIKLKCFRSSNKARRKRKLEVAAVSSSSGKLVTSSKRTPTVQEKETFVGELSR